MIPCGSAGQPCPRSATVTVRIAGVGDRRLCPECHAWQVAQGMDVRVLEPDAHVPEWRTRGLARDLSGRLFDRGRIAS